MKNRIKDYLVSGIPPGQVATIVGCTPAYISQLLKDEHFKNSVDEAIRNKPKEAEEVDLSNKYTALEHTLLKRIDQASLEADLPALVKALEVVTRRKDSKLIQGTTPNIGQFGAINVNVVSVQLPPHALQAPSIVLNEKKEILSINNQNLAPLSSEAVKNLFVGIKKRKELQESQELIEDFHKFP